MSPGSANGEQAPKVEMAYRSYDQTPEDLQHIVRLVETELSEPYTVYTYRYFLHQWPRLAFLAFSGPDETDAVGIVVCKLESHRGKTMRGYLAMLSVHPDWRNRGIAKHLLRLAIDEMRAQGADEVVLETEADNEKSLGLYERMGFWREKRLWRFYLNGKDAFRLILPLKTPPPPLSPPAVFAPPPPVQIEDDFGSAPFLSAETFAPGAAAGVEGAQAAPSPLELSPALAALVQRAHDDDANNDDDDEVGDLPSFRPAPPALQQNDDDGDVEIEDLPPPSPTKPSAPQLDDRTPPPPSPAGEDGGLEALEVSDEEGTAAGPGAGSDESDVAAGDDGVDWEGGRRVSEGLATVSI